jgi:hypothetical protein
MQIRFHENELLDFSDWSDLIRLPLSDIAENRDKSINHLWLLVELFKSYTKFVNLKDVFNFRFMHELLKHIDNSAIIDDIFRVKNKSYNIINLNFNCVDMQNFCALK